MGAGQAQIYGPVLRNGHLRVPTLGTNIFLLHILHSELSFAVRTTLQSALSLLHWLGLLVECYKP